MILVIFCNRLRFNFILFFLMPFLLLIPFGVLAQNCIYGKILDANTNEPIKYAAVYINGSTIGTNTNEFGTFTLKNISLPCNLIISRLGYTIKSLIINNANTELTILLNEKKILLGEVNVKGQNLREQNFKYFKMGFLGTDEWGKRAILQNDSSLIYKCLYNKKVVNNINNANIDSTWFDIKWSENRSFYIKPC